MAEVSFWAQVKNADKTQQIVEKLNLIMETFYNREDYEVIVIDYTSDATESLAGLEQKYPENVMLINCDGSETEAATDIMLDYAKGNLFLEISAEISFDSNMFDRALYDANICDDDTFKFLRNKYTYIYLGAEDESFRYQKDFEKKCLSDYRDNAGSIDLHYFYQDIYVASKVNAMGLKHIYDIGSRVDGYISHLLSMGIEVTMIDIRPLNYQVEGLSFIQGNATELTDIAESSIDNLSCLHALEHFGLGRYGDPMDYNGWKKALSHYKRVIKPRGNLVLSVPVGKTQRACFNAHRIFRPMTIVRELAPEMRLLEYTNIHNAKRTTFDFGNNSNAEKIEEVLECYSNSSLGEYDCGIFHFVRT
ncbi:MAG: DUF268 domain-containing protein [Butyrivibrio sp.]|uniref:DUF268 domain-containing protein n=1 Tax=Butyrivibrio sp. TaxID=28121 RepID=UPI0025BD0C5E|nr:DUF268 domain-containing protein [Butyrivibrio sp.]MBQ6588685.1 DUF268 domain-containing protein [Butyrivibrio sp.]